MTLLRFKVIGILLLVVVVVVLVYIFINTFYIAKDYLYGLPLRFIQNRYVSVDVYPNGYQSATVFTNNNIEAKTPEDDIAILRHFLKKRNLRGVFFVIPNYTGSLPLDKSPEVLKELKSLKADGHEIAQYGTYHTYGPDLSLGLRPGEEFLRLGYDEQKERVEEGKDLLAKAGFPPAGFRAPDFLSNRETFRVLEACGFVYSSNAYAPPTTGNTFFRPSLLKGVLYPYHPDSFDILEFTDHADPTFKFHKAVRLFKRIHEMQGVFVYHTFMEEVYRPERLEILEKFLSIVQKENTWCCTLSELSQWWLARERLQVETKKEGQSLVVTLLNETPYPLANLGISIVKYPHGVRDYVVQDYNERVIVRGSLPLKNKISITVPGNPES